MKVLTAGIIMIASTALHAGSQQQSMAGNGEYIRSSTRSYEVVLRNQQQQGEGTYFIYIKDQSGNISGRLSCDSYSGQCTKTVSGQQQQQGQFNSPIDLSPKELERLKGQVD